MIVEPRLLSKGNDATAMMYQPGSEGRRVYVACSRRNPFYDSVVKTVQGSGWDVYDFKHPPSGPAFNFGEVDAKWYDWTTWQFMNKLRHPRVTSAYDDDKQALDEADYGILVLPSLSGAYARAGYLLGKGIPVLAYLPSTVTVEPDLMYKLFTLPPFGDIMQLLVGLRDLRPAHEHT